MTLAQQPLHPEINLSDEFLFERGEAHEAFRTLRRDAPVHWNPGTEIFNGFWSITKYADVLFISRHPELFISSKGIAGSGVRHPELYPVPEGGVDGASIITMDPPRHV